MFYDKAYAERWPYAETIYRELHPDVEVVKAELKQIRKEMRWAKRIEERQAIIELFQNYLPELINEANEIRAQAVKRATMEAMSEMNADLAERILRED